LRVAFYHSSPFHHAMLDPVQRELQDEHVCARVDDPGAVARFAPDVVVLAEHFRDHLREVVPSARIVWTRHGLAGKRYVAESLANCDYACLSSAWTRDDYAARGWQPRRDSWITGFVPMDALHRAIARPRDGRVRLLYAPTHNPALNSIKGLGKHWPQQLRRALPQLEIVLKPHPHTFERDPLAIARMQAWCEADAGVRLVDDPEADVYPLLADADVLLSDASSVMLYFLALDRPMVAFSNPARGEDTARYDPDAYEWRWRDMAEEIGDADALVAAVRRCLDDPAARAPQRAQYRERLLGDTFDGNVARRVADHIRRLA
jgi:CDP-glycerol glycerophosphotransferase (TagB/SpsB family)